MVIVVLHRRSACWSFSLKKFREAGKARLRSEPNTQRKSSCDVPASVIGRLKVTGRERAQRRHPRRACPRLQLMNLPRCPPRSLLTGNTIVATTNVVTTCFASADCTDFAIPTCSGDICVTMSCGGGSLTPDGAYDSLWDNVKPMTA